MISPSQAAACMGVGESTIRNWIKGLGLPGSVKLYAHKEQHGFRMHYRIEPQALISFANFYNLDLDHERLGAFAAQVLEREGSN